MWQVWKNSGNSATFSVKSYKPSGTPIINTQTTTEKFRFANEIQDAPSGLYYIGARWMDPELGRFVSLDPQLGSLSAPQSMNRYVYCVNNPLMYKDPTGQNFWSWLKGLFFSNDYRYNPIDNRVEIRNGKPTLPSGFVYPWENKGWQACMGTVFVVGTGGVALEYYAPAYIEPLLTFLGIGSEGSGAGIPAVGNAQEIENFLTETSGSKIPVIASQDIPVYRVYGAGSKLSGSYWTTENPGSMSQIEYRLQTGLFDSNGGGFMARG